MSKKFLKKCFENLKLIAPLMLAAFIVFGLLGFAIYLLFHYTNIFVGFIATYIVCVIFATWLFTSLFYDEESDSEDKDETPTLPFMPN